MPGPEYPNLNQSLQTTRDVEEAARIVAAGGVIAYPTEAVFGLGCDPGNSAAIAKLLKAKERSRDKGLILVASNQAQLSAYMAGVTDEQQQRLDIAWPGPVTFIVPAASGVSAALTGGRDTIAVRVSDHPLVVALCDACGSALVSTSANTSGQAPYRTTNEWMSESRTAADSQLLQHIDLLLLGKTGNREKPSDIIDLQTGQRLR